MRHILPEAVDEVGKQVDPVLQVADGVTVPLRPLVEHQERGDAPQKEKEEEELHEWAGLRAPNRTDERGLPQAERRAE